jgi:hypothetical protein
LSGRRDSNPRPSHGHQVAHGGHPSQPVPLRTTRWSLSCPAIARSRSPDSSTAPASTPHKFRPLDSSERASVPLDVWRDVRRHQLGVVLVEHPPRVLPNELDVRSDCCPWFALVRVHPVWPRSSQSRMGTIRRLASASATRCSSSTDAGSWKLTAVTSLASRSSAFAT